MEDKVFHILNRVRQAAQQATVNAEATARQAGRKATAMLDITRLNVQIYDLNTEVSILLKSAGQIVYNAHLGIDTDEEMLSSILANLDEKNAQIMELRGRIDALKYTRECPGCGGACSAEDRFCKVCGTDLTI